MKTKLTQEQIEYIKNSVDKDAALTLEGLVDNIYNERQKELNSMSKEELQEKTGSDKLDVFAEKKGKELANRIYTTYSEQTQQQIDLAKQIQQFYPEIENNNLTPNHLNTLIKYLETDMLLSDAVYSATLRELDKMINNSIKDMFLAQGITEEEFSAIPEKQLLEIIEGTKKQVLGASPETQQLQRERIDSYNKTEKIVEVLKKSLVQTK